MDPYISIDALDLKPPRFEVWNPEQTLMKQNYSKNMVREGTSWGYMIDRRVTPKQLEYLLKIVVRVHLRAIGGQLIWPFGQFILFMIFLLRFSNEFQQFIIRLLLLLSLYFDDAEKLKNDENSFSANEWVDMVPSYNFRLTSLTNIMK